MPYFALMPAADDDYDDVDYAYIFRDQNQLARARLIGFPSDNILLGPSVVRL